MKHLQPPNFSKPCPYAAHQPTKHITLGRECTLSPNMDAEKTFCWNWNNMHAYRKCIFYKIKESAEK